MMTLLLLFNLFGFPDADQLGLSSQQRMQMRDLTDEGRAQQRKIRADIDLAEIDLRRELEKDTPDSGRISGIVDHLSSLEAQARKTQITTWLKVRALLTRDQRTKLESERRAEELVDPLQGIEGDPTPRALEKYREAVRDQELLRQKLRQLERHRSDLERNRADMERARAELERVHQGFGHGHGSGSGETTLSVSSTPPSRVLIDGRDIGMTPLVRVLVEPGHHRVTFKAGDKTTTTDVEVGPGSQTQISKKLD